jgi:hypothetical protein
VSSDGGWRLRDDDSDSTPPTSCSQMASSGLEDGEVLTGRASVASCQPRVSSLIVTYRHVLEQWGSDETYGLQKPPSNALCVDELER